MVSTRDSFRLEDLEQLDSYSAGIVANDTPGTALLKHYLLRNDGQWRHYYNAPNASGSYDTAARGRNKDGQSWGLNNGSSLSDMQKLDRWIKH